MKKIYEIYRIYKFDRYNVFVCSYRRIHNLKMLKQNNIKGTIQTVLD